MTSIIGTSITMSPLQRFQKSKNKVQKPKRKVASSKNHETDTAPLARSSTSTHQHLEMVVEEEAEWEVEPEERQTERDVGGGGSANFQADLDDYTRRYERGDFDKEDSVRSIKGRSVEEEDGRMHSDEFGHGSPSEILSDEEEKRHWQSTE
ncbi:hypothetical protein NHQ30_005858 [Ciborinia camelliae]|nr:hypothetical protein NHQ30_005858 [Ciborinia camelliae]